MDDKLAASMALPSAELMESYLVAEMASWVVKHKSINDHY